MKNYTPREDLDNALKYWWLIALLAILGGALGWLFHSLRSPVYDAKAVISISIDFPEEYQLTQFEEDHAVNMAAAVIISDPVMEKVVEAAQAQGIEIDMPTLWSKLHLERRQERWTLIIRDADPDKAAILASQFAELGIEALAEAYSHALEARSLERIAAGLESCLGDLEEGEVPAEVCSRMTTAEIQAELERINEALAPELLAGQGVLATTVFSLTRQASPPTEPVQFGRNILVLAGGLIGFLVGIVVVSLRAPQHLADRRRGSP